MSCSSSDVQENFKFSLSYSVENTNLISSIDNIVILDTIEGSIEKPLVFKDDEITLIRDEFLRLGLKDIDYDFLLATHHHIQPNMISKIRVICDDENYEFTWSSNSMPYTIEMKDDEDVELDESNSAVIRSIDSFIKVPIKGYEDKIEDYYKMISFNDFILSIVEEKGVKDDFPPLHRYE